jgi:hypothetical protein
MAGITFEKAVKFEYALILQNSEELNDLMPAVLQGNL